MRTDALMREGLRYLREPVPLPRELEQYLHYFCRDAAKPNRSTIYPAFGTSNQDGHALCVAGSAI